MIVLGIFCAAYGLAYILFAFTAPPSMLRGFFRVPAIFVFLPENQAARVGRVFVGICSLIASGVVFRALLF